MDNLKLEIKELEKVLNKKFKLPAEEEPKILEVKESTKIKDEEANKKNLGNTFSPPRHIHSSDKILLLQDEILVLPHDIEGEESNDTENVFYPKADSRRLEKFLLEEAAAV